MRRILVLYVSQIYSQESQMFVKCWSVAIGFFNTFSLKVIYVRFVHLGYTVLKRMLNIKITTEK